MNAAGCLRTPNIVGASFTHCDLLSYPFKELEILGLIVNPGGKELTILGFTRIP